MITKSGGVKLVDFGLVNLSGRSVLTQEGTTLGTMAYMVPEQTQGAGWDHRTDIWALGAVLYEMVSGQQPFKGDYEQVVAYSIMNEEAEPADGSAHRRSYGIGKNRQQSTRKRSQTPLSECCGSSCGFEKASRCCIFEINTQVHLQRTCTS